MRTFMPTVDSMINVSFDTKAAFAASLNIPRSGAEFYRNVLKRTAHFIAGARYFLFHDAVSHT